MAKIKTYKNIYGRNINVNGLPRAEDEVFEEEETRELKRLVAQKYIEEVK